MTASSQEDELEISERLLHAINVLVPKYRQYKTLEELTGVSAERWKAFCHGRQRPNAEMLQEFGIRYPQLCLWLLTGRTYLGGEQYDPEVYKALAETNAHEIISEIDPVSISANQALVVAVEVDKHRVAKRILRTSVPSDELEAFINARGQSKTKNEIFREAKEKARRNADSWFFDWPKDDKKSRDQIRREYINKISTELEKDPGFGAVNELLNDIVLFKAILNHARDDEQLSAHLVKQESASIRQSIREKGNAIGIYVPSKPVRRENTDSGNDIPTGTAGTSTNDK